MSKWYMHNLEFVLENETYKLALGFWDTNGSPNLGQTTRSSDRKQTKKIKKKKRKKKERKKKGKKRQPAKSLTLPSRQTTDSDWK